jgi:hypothetical protein
VRIIQNPQVQSAELLIVTAAGTYCYQLASKGELEVGDCNFFTLKMACLLMVTYIITVFFLLFEATLSVVVCVQQNARKVSN